MEKLLHVFNELGWQDVVDIGLNSYILFRFYVLFRGTYVFRVLIGLTMLWFFQQTDLFRRTTRGFWSGANIIPLFEGIDDLRRAHEIMRTLFAHPVYKHYLKARDCRQAKHDGGVTR